MKYRIELTDVQLNAVLRAVNLMMRTGMGQTDDLTEWLVTMGDNIKFDTSTEKGKRVFEDYYSTREAIRPVIHGVMMGCWRGPNKKSDTVLELETLYEALRHQEWLDTEERFESDVRAREPMQWGNEPIPKIEEGRVMNSKQNEWHNLRKNPEDMPPNAKHLGALCPRYDVMTKYGQTIGWFNPDRDAWFVLVWLIYYDPKPQISMKMGDVPKVLKCGRNSNFVIAWREIDEYEEDVACM